MPIPNSTCHNPSFELSAVTEVVFAVQTAISKTNPEYAAILAAVCERLDDIDQEFKDLLKAPRT